MPPATNVLKLLDFFSWSANPILMTQDLVPIEIPEEHWGPCMQALNPRQRAFVAACLSIGTTNNARAAAMAGYQGSPNTLAVAGHRLAHHSGVIAAIQEEAERRLRSSAIMAVTVMVDIARNEVNSPKDRLKAAEMIANRVGLHARSEHKVITEDASTTDAAMTARIQTLCGQLGIDPKTLLGRMAQKAEPKVDAIVEAEYAEIAQPEKEEWE